MTPKPGPVEAEAGEGKSHLMLKSKGQRLSLSGRTLHWVPSLCVTEGTLYKGQTNLASSRKSAFYFILFKFLVQ